MSQAQGSAPATGAPPPQTHRGIVKMVCLCVCCVCVCVCVCMHMLFLYQILVLISWWTHVKAELPDHLDHQQFKQNSNKQ